MKNKKNTMLIVTHDMAVHANVAEKIAIMYAGKIVEIAEKKELFTLSLIHISVADQWRKFGVEVNVETLESGPFFSRQAIGDYDVGSFWGGKMCIRDRK